MTIRLSTPPQSLFSSGASTPQDLGGFDSSMAGYQSRMGATIGVALDVLRGTFGHAQFRGLQAGVIGEVLAGRSALAVLPTGGGKSLCYQIPSLVRPGLGLVISPLIALMADQVAALQQLGIAAERLEFNHEPRFPRGYLAAHQRHRSGPALCLARRPDAALDAGTPQGPPARPSRDRRSTLRQPVGPRLSPRIPHARPPRGHLSHVFRASPSPPLRMPARAMISAPSCSCRTPVNLSTASRDQNSPCRPSANRRRATTVFSSSWPSGQNGPG